MACERCNAAREAVREWLAMLPDDPPPRGEDKGLDEAEARIDEIGFCEGVCDEERKA